MMMFNRNPSLNNESTHAGRTWISSIYSCSIQCQFGPDRLTKQSPIIIIPDSDPYYIKYTGVYCVKEKKSLWIFNDLHKYWRAVKTSSSAGVFYYSVIRVFPVIRRDCGEKFYDYLLDRHSRSLLYLQMLRRNFITHDGCIYSGPKTLYIGVLLSIIQDRTIHMFRLCIYAAR